MAESGVRQGDTTKALRALQALQGNANVATVTLASVEVLDVDSLREVQEILESAGRVLEQARRAVDAALVQVIRCGEDA